jgi:DNA-binding NarL/FixJ family response regulator
MTHTTTIAARSVAAERGVPIVPSLSRDAPTSVPLTAAESAVLHLLANGHSNAQIGQCLRRSEKTIRNQLTRIYAKLHVANRAQAVAVHMRMEFERDARAST